VITDPASLLPTPQSLRDSASRYGILLPLVCTGIVVSTLRSAVSTIRVRLSFEKYHSPYSEAGALSFYDINGDPTFDPAKAEPLRRGVEKVYLKS
jgi:hypothetical protein